MKKLLLIILLFISSTSFAQFYPFYFSLSSPHTWTRTQTFDSLKVNKTLSLYNLNGNRWFYANGEDSTLTINGGNFKINPNQTNIGIGTGVLKVSTGTNNIAVGEGVLGNNTTGSINLGIGNYSLRSITTGYSNIGIGLWSLGLMTTGYQNMGIGNNAGKFLTNGTSANSTAINSLYIGVNTKASTDGCRNEIVIGYNAIGNGSNSVTLGNDSVAKTILRGNILNDSTITTASYKQKSVVAIADSTINCNLSNTFSKTLGANQRFVLSNIGDGQTVNIAVTNTAGNYTVTWIDPAGLTIKWSGGTAPVATIGEKTDIWTFVRIGTTIYGNVSQNY